MSIKIGITDCNKWTNYEKWIRSLSPEVEIIRLKVGETSVEQVKRCAGIILTGGEDIHPEYYGKPEYVDTHKLTDLNRERDEFELSVLKSVVDSNTPLLGICRGLQIANVFLGGSLVPDLPSIGKSIHSSADGKGESQHPVQLMGKSKLLSIIGQLEGEINSHHHQAAGTIGQGLKTTAIASDGTVEGLENNEHDFFILVQWHPERMSLTSPFSMALGEAFINAAMNFLHL